MTSSHSSKVRRFFFIAALCAPGLLIATGGTARAQGQPQDVRPLLDRLDRLERDMNMLQRQVYRPTGPNGAPVAVSPPDPQSALSNEVRMGQIEDQMRTLTGQVEEFNYNLDQLKRRVDTLSSDLDLRLSQLEHGGSGGAAVPPPPPPPDAAGGPPPQRGRGAGANPGEPPSQSGVLGKIPVGASDHPPPPQQAAAPASSGALPSGSPQDQYNYAFGLLRRADYPNAEQALKSFVQRYPNDALAGNAQYWLGETYYVRKDYNNAAVAFAEGYQKYPKGAKAADDLLKLGMALGNLGQKADACRSFARLDRDFPAAPANIKDRLTSEKQRLAC